jgi:hypothetical protein
VTDPEKLDAEAAALLYAPRPLRDRIAGYLAGFVLGGATIAAVGAVIALFGAPIRSAIGYTAITVGVLLALAGGSSGAGLSSLGIGEGIGRMVSHSNPSLLLDEDGADLPRNWGSRKYGVVLEPTDRQDLIGRLRRGLRPERNPAAFWLVIAGSVYGGIGVLLFLL